MTRVAGSDAAQIWFLLTSGIVVVPAAALRPAGTATATITANWMPSEAATLTSSSGPSPSAASTVARSTTRRSRVPQGGEHQGRNRGERGED